MKLFIHKVRLCHRRGWFVGSFLAIMFAVFLLPAGARAADEGQDLFKAKCANCHGEDGVGQTNAGKALKAPDLASSYVQAESDKVMADAIKKGKNKMPAVKGLNPKQVKDLVAVVRAFAKK